MRPYLAVFDARFRTLLQYRGAALAGFGTQFFWGLMRMMIFTAFYHASTASQPMRLEEVVSYVWLGQALLGILPFRPDAEVAAMVRSGNISYEIVRPVDLYSIWFCRAIAQRTAPTVLRAVPMLILAVMLLGLRLPPTWSAASLFVLSLAAAILLSSAITVLLSVSLLWTISGEGVATLVPGLSWILCGIIIPLPLLPAWSQGILNVLPFRGLMDVPFRIYTGHIGAAQAIPQIALQLAWVTALVILGRTLLARGLRRVVVQGG